MPLAKFFLNFTEISVVEGSEGKRLMVTGAGMCVWRPSPLPIRKIPKGCAAAKRGAEELRRAGTRKWI